MEWEVELEQVIEYVEAVEETVVSELGADTAAYAERFEELAWK